MHVQHPKGNSSNPSSIPKNPIDGQKTHSVRKKIYTVSFSSFPEYHYKENNTQLYIWSKNNNDKNLVCDLNCWMKIADILSISD